MRTYKPWALLISGMLVLAPLSTMAAGRGGGTFAGDGGVATEARLNNPRGVAVDQAGNLYIADSSNDRIRRIDRRTGLITTVAGSGERGFGGDGGPALSAKLYFPHSLALDAVGDLYIADAGNHRIRKVDVSIGTVSTLAGTGDTWAYGESGPATAAGLFAPRGVTVDGNGIVYISDTQNGCIRRVDRHGQISTLTGSNPRRRGSKNLRHPVGLAVGPDGQIYWADATLNRVKKADPSRIDPETKSGWITIVAGSETMGFSGDGGLAREAELGEPAAVVFDSKGNLYIAEHNNVRIRRVDAKTGVITTIAGNGTRGFSGDGGPATDASLNAPAGLAFDADGNLYIADAQNHRIRKIEASTGIITTVAGGGLSDEAPLTNSHQRSAISGQLFVG
ncbi:MAG: hypothetical protein HY581_02710 [Nitrospirae bacterium]|nr:hypothetical protein [Nitrospirota bacterium]